MSPTPQGEGKDVLLEVYDLKGDLHVHSHWSDGVNTLEELALEARRRGYQYLAVTDHSKSSMWHAV